MAQHAVALKSQGCLLKREGARRKLKERHSSRPDGRFLFDASECSITRLCSLRQGVIINGAIRDSAQVAKLPLGVKALGANPTKSGKGDPGEANVTVSFAGLTFEPGHWVSFRQRLCTQR